MLKSIFVNAKILILSYKISIFAFTKIVLEPRYLEMISPKILLWWLFLVVFHIVVWKAKLKYYLLFTIIEAKLAPFSSNIFESFIIKISWFRKWWKWRIIEEMNSWWFWLILYRAHRPSQKSLWIIKIYKRISKHKHVDKTGTILRLMIVILAAHLFSFGNCSNFAL